MSRSHLLFLVLLLSLGGCAGLPPSVEIPPTAGGGERTALELYALARREQVTDARFQAVRGWCCLFVDQHLRYRIADYTRLHGLEAKRALLRQILQRSAQLADKAMGLYLQRLPRPRLAAFVRTHPAFGEAGVEVATAADPAPGSIDPDAFEVSPDSVLAAYRRQTRKSLEQALAQVDALATEDDADAWWHRFQDAIEPSILTRGRLLRRLMTLPLAPAIDGWITWHEATDYRGPWVPHFRRAIAYRPLADAPRPAEIDEADWRLLRHFAPVVVQEQAEHPAYPADSDLIGRVSLQGRSLEEATPRFDTAHPALYAYVEHKEIDGTPVRQLVYVFFYPRHPKNSPFDPEAGPVDGWTLRITLDGHDRPKVFESVLNCGCYYRIFPTRELERESAKAYARPLPGKRFVLENHLKDRNDAEVPELVSGLDPARDEEIWLYYSAGRHQLLTIRSRATAVPVPRLEERRYRLLAYDELESLPFHDRRASLFDEQGLVRGAARPESYLLTPSGLYYAGWPRQRQTRMVYFDEMALDDPALLPTYLRLPKGALQ